MEPIHSSPALQGTILLVDDEAGLRRLLSRMLEEAGFAVLEAENGAVALDLARRLNGQFHLVITDIHMPVMTGPQFVQAFRPIHPGIPILYITGRDLVPGLEPGPGKWEILRKPFRAEAFLAVVNRMLNGAA